MQPSHLDRPMILAPPDPVPQRPPEQLRAVLRGDPIPWLLEASAPPTRHLALRDLFDRPSNDRDFIAARAAAMASDRAAASDP